MLCVPSPLLYSHAQTLAVRETLVLVLLYSTIYYLFMTIGHKRPYEPTIPTEPLFDLPPESIEIIPNRIITSDSMPTDIVDIIDPAPVEYPFRDRIIDIARTSLKESGYATALLEELIITTPDDKLDELIKLFIQITSTIDPRIETASIDRGLYSWVDLTKARVITDDNDDEFFIAPSIDKRSLLDFLEDEDIDSILISLVMDESTYEEDVDDWVLPASTVDVHSAIADLESINGPDGPEPSDVFNSIFQSLPPSSRKELIFDHTPSFEFGSIAEQIGRYIEQAGSTDILTLISLLDRDYIVENEEFTASMLVFPAVDEQGYYIESGVAYVKLPMPEVRAMLLARINALSNKDLVSNDPQALFSIEDFCVDFMSWVASEKSL